MRPTTYSIVVSNHTNHRRYNIVARRKIAPQSRAEPNPVAEIDFGVMEERKNRFVLYMCQTAK